MLLRGLLDLEQPLPVLAALDEISRLLLFGVQDNTSNCGLVSLISSSGKIEKVAPTLIDNWGLCIVFPGFRNREVLPDIGDILLRAVRLLIAMLVLVALVELNTDIHEVLIEFCSLNWIQWFTSLSQFSGNPS